MRSGWPEKLRKPPGTLCRGWVISLVRLHFSFYHQLSNAFFIPPEKLANTERHLDLAKGHSNKAADRTEELKQLNRSIFIPVMKVNKDARHAASEARVQARYDEEREDRERSRMDVRDTQNRIGRAQTYGRSGSGDSDELLGGRRSRTEDQNARRAADRKRYQFEATGSDDELEDEIDDNLDEIGDMAKRLRALATATGDELDAQNKRIDIISGKTDKVAGKLDNVTAQVSRFTIPFLESTTHCIHLLQQKKW
jgi:hypothetical protein